MKVILTGATGNTGSHALRRLLSFPSVTAVVILSRRELTPPPTSPKVTTLILTEAEFLSYPPSVVEALKGASGCVWTLGKIPERTPEGLKQAERVAVGYPTELMRAVAANPALESGEPFRFVFTSGGLIPEDPNASLWFGASWRKLSSEKLLWFQNVAAENPKLDFVVAKPWFIRPANAGVSLFSLFPTLQIPVDFLAAALVDIVMEGSEKKNLRNEDLKARGIAALTRVPWV